MSNTPNTPNAPDTATESNADFVQRTSVTVGELRKTHGAHFAPGFQDSDKLGLVLSNAGVNTLEDLLAQTRKP